MVDDLMVCVDRIIVTSSCFEPVNNGERNGSNVVRVEGTGEDSNVKESIGSVKGNEEGSSCSLNKVEMVECRICQEEDEVLALEAPCSCNGTLKLKVVFFLFYGEAVVLCFWDDGFFGSKFAHRKCIQRWCNKKGDITCEICNQVFSPNYSLPPARSNPDFMAIDIRQAWGHHIDLHDPHLLALEHQLLQSEYEDYAVANTSSLACLRSVALILLIILLLRQALMVTRESGMVQEMSSFFSFQVSLLQYAGFLLPCYVMARSWYIAQSRRRRHVYLLIIYSTWQALLPMAICHAVFKVTATKLAEKISIGKAF
ncbi:hypothetical protein DKX38_029760 [Salix brachista]|uniref:RING-CH-type domain-containing protein n=1 Tax=Salix brachista TaxID=2182728 RepID=A0A5N5J1K1_9ROSI|nr:hypothetical protein DKX38_029760 [Salix brachista]